MIEIMAADLMVSEIFGPTIQGEGCKVGKPSIFIRLGGCDQTPPCKWCDTMRSYSLKSNNYKSMNTFSIIEEVLVLLDYDKTLLSQIPLVITGGNPCIQDCIDLINGFRHIHEDCVFYVETQGTEFPKWLSKVNHLVISPKPPSSYDNHPEGQSIWPIIEYLRTHELSRFRTKEIKIVIFDLEDDYKYMIDSFSQIINEVRSFNKTYVDFLNFTIQLGTINNKENEEELFSISSITERLIKKLIIDMSYSNDIRHIFDTNLRILPQVHTILRVR